MKASLIAATIFNKPNANGEEIYTLKIDNRYLIGNDGGVCFYSKAEHALRDLEEYGDEYIQVPHSTGSDLYVMKVGDVLGIWDNNMNLCEQFDSLEEIVEAVMEHEYEAVLNSFDIVR